MYRSRDINENAVFSNGGTNLHIPENPPSFLEGNQSEIVQRTPEYKHPHKPCKIEHFWVDPHGKWTMAPPTACRDVSACLAQKGF